MLNSNWQTVRLGLLAVTFAGTAIVWARLALLPKANSDAAQKPENTLQTAVPLPGWQLLGSEPLSVADPNKAETNSKEANEAKMGRRYRYQQGDITLQADQVYMQSDGNVSRYLFVYSPIRTANSSMKIKFQPGTGHYGLVVHDQKAYLSACVNPRGESTVTESQFTQNRYTNDINPVRLVPWLLGQESLIDYRCLWTLMSVPLPADSGTKTAVLDDRTTKTLETAWVSWHQWWQSHYPRPQ